MFAGSVSVAGHLHVQTVHRSVVTLRQCIVGLINCSGLSPHVVAFSSPPLCLSLSFTHSLSAVMIGLFCTAQPFCGAHRSAQCGAAKQHLNYTLLSGASAFTTVFLVLCFSTD